MLTTSTVAIIVPTLNRPHTLPRCLRSIRAQTYENWICIVINQGEPIERVKDKRFVYVDRHQKSASLARNMGFSMALCIGVEYVCAFDDDDWIERDYLQEMVGVLDRDTGAVLVACNGTYDGQTYKHDHPSTKLVGSRMVRASCVDDTSKFKARSGQEKHFWRSFDGELQGHIDKTLYRASRDPIGGLRDTEGSY